MNIICLLSVRPDIKSYNFLKKIKENTKYEVMIVIDDNNYNIPNYDMFIQVIKINNIECENNGYKSSVLWLDNKACSRDKALYYFNKQNIEYEYIWFLEEDVFIPDIFTIKNIDEKYGSDDLLCAKNNIIYEKPTDWHWNHVNKQIKIEPPYASSMICAIRCSKKMMKSIDDYAKKYNNLFLDESLFNTLAVHNNLQVNTIPELKTIVYRTNWKLSDIVKTNLYHPIKDINIHYDFRNNLK
jgi:hypothetical protein